VAAAFDSWQRFGKPAALERLLSMFTSGPASLLPRPWNSLGSLKEGAAADVTVIDLDAVRMVDVNSWKSKARICPWNGEILRGWPVMTVVDGKIIMNRLGDGE
jgi:dihydroorotase